MSPLFYVWSVLGLRLVREVGSGRLHAINEYEASVGSSRSQYLSPRNAAQPGCKNHAMKLARKQKDFTRWYALG
ncbi:hypothetical protein BTM36_21410 [Herbaspirillum sp. VT-16-41]|nr:hypothetical protein BTM36_21410 [Herbaspirillum sp. VT-16-41]